MKSSLTSTPKWLVSLPELWQEVWLRYEQKPRSFVAKRWPELGRVKQWLAQLAGEGMNGGLAQLDDGSYLYAFFFLTKKQLKSGLFWHVYQVDWRQAADLPALWSELNPNQRARLDGYYVLVETAEEMKELGVKLEFQSFFSEMHDLGIDP